LPSGFSEALRKDDNKQRQTLSEDEQSQRHEVVDQRCHGTEHVGKIDADKVAFH